MKDQESILFDLPRELLSIREPVELIGAVDRAAQRLGLPVVLGLAAEPGGRLAPLPEYRETLERWLIGLEEGVLKRTLPLEKLLGLDGGNPFGPLRQGRIVCSHRGLAPAGAAVLKEGELLDYLSSAGPALSWEELRSLNQALGLGGFCALPLGGNPLAGVLLLAPRPGVTDWGPERRKLLSSLAGLVDPILDGLAGRESLPALVLEGQAWFAIARVMSLPRLSLNTRLKRCLEAVLELHQAGTGSIMIRRGDSLEVRAASNKKILGLKQRIDSDTIAAYVARTGLSLNLRHLAGDHRFKLRVRERSLYSTDQALAVPIGSGRKVVGVINLTDRAGGQGFDPAEERRIIGFMGRIGGFIDRALLNDVLKKERVRLKKVNQRLIRLERTTKDLTHMVVHDLKGPLAEVVANLHLLTDEELSIFGQEALGAALVGTDSLGRLIQNLLQIGRLEEGRMLLEPRPVSLWEAVEGVLERLKTLLDRQGQEVVLAIEPEFPKVMADGGILDRILQNLVVNAVEHTPSGGRLTFRALSGPGRAEFSLADRGPGIAPAQRDSIFDKFSGSEERRGPGQSTGLGLAFCRLAVEAQGGRIWVEEAPGGGADFRFTLPFAEEK